MGSFTPVARKLSDLLSDIDCGKLRLPSFQRDYKWTAPKVKKLIDSIQCNHPAGSLLLLNVDYNNMMISDMSFSFTDTTKQIENVKFLVLDGQQRLTSCYAAFYNLGNKTYFLDYKRLMDLDKEMDGKGIEFEELIIDKRHMDYPAAKLDEGLLPLSFIRDKKTFRDSLKEYKDSIRANHEKDDIYDFLDTRLSDFLDPIFDYEFPVVELPESLSLDAVCKVFQTINSTGLKLSAFDICVAKFMRYGLDLKKMVKEAKENSYLKMVADSDETMILQTVALLAGKAPKKNALADTLVNNDIEQYWNGAIEGIITAVKVLDGFGAGTTENLTILPYQPIIPLYAAIITNRDFNSLSVDARGNITNKLKIFFYCSALTSRYTEGTDNKLRDDYDSILSWISGGSSPAIVKNGVMWNTSKYIGATKQSAFGKAILCLVNNQNPKDFYEDKMVGFGENTVSTQIHHIFPEAKYKNMVEDINSVFNFTFLTGDANNFISDKNTRDYIDEIIRSKGISVDSIKEVFEKHLIDEKCFSALYDEEYEDFISYRCEMICSKLQKMGITIKTVEKEQIDEQLDDDDLVDETE